MLRVNPKRLRGYFPIVDWGIHKVVLTAIEMMGKFRLRSKDQVNG
jgi:hypothetical protein